MAINSNDPAFTPEGTIGPFFPYIFTERAPANAASAAGLTHKPAGTPIIVTGRLFDDQGRALRSMIIETWQANAFGRYRHPADQDDHRPLDPAFDGFARLRTDNDGRYMLRTIKPGARASVHDPIVFRAPHIRLTIFGSGIDRVVTTLFFDDEPLNETDPLLRSVAEAEIRQRLLARRANRLAPGDVVVYDFDIVMRGARETPFFDDWGA